MSILSRFLSGALLCALSTAALQAQYTVNTANEKAYAENENNHLFSFGQLIAVPHLNPTAVALAMQNNIYNPWSTNANATPFKFVIAHRGFHTAPLCAENSACSIQAAYDAGADGIELDVKTTQDGAPVLGHDYTTGRELNNWASSPGGPQVTRNESLWSPFLHFPIGDNIYLYSTKFPFLQNATGSSGCTANTEQDPNNPSRPCMMLSQLQNSADLTQPSSVMVDTYDQPTLDHQLTLYEAMYLIQKYYPMMIWLDIKNPKDLKLVGPVIAAARAALGNTGALTYIGLKLDYTTLAAVDKNGNPVVNFNPGQYLNLPNIYYFYVFGTGNLDAMAVLNQTAPSSAAQAAQQAQITFESTCIPANGCLGGELNHKYDNSPTQSMYNYLTQAAASTSMQVASFQTVPQYAWYWDALTAPGDPSGTTSATAKLQASTYGRFFPRTDGSCCFSLKDALNTSKYLGPENQDLRDLFSWNEANFSTITTDEPLRALHDLYVQNYRKASTVVAIGATNVSVQSGGGSVFNQTLKDGMYNINFLNYFLAVSGGNIATQTNNAPNAMWYFQQVMADQYTITNAGTGKSLCAVGGSLQAITMTWSTGECLWDFLSQGTNTAGTAILASFINGNNALTYTGSAVSLGEYLDMDSQVFTFTSVSAPSSEISRQQGGPSGYTFCADGDTTPFQRCNLPAGGSLAYGANGSFYIWNYTSGNIACSLWNFANIDPAVGTKKSCFYAPFNAASQLSSSYGFPVSTGQAFYIGSGESVSYGATLSTGAMYTYGIAGSNTSKYCEPSLFGGYDPLPPGPYYVTEYCRTAPSDPYVLSPNLSHYTFCAHEGEDCVFSGTASVAFGATGQMTYEVFANGVNCSATAFGWAPGTVAGTPPGSTPRDCFYANAAPYVTASSTSLSPLFTQCAVQKGTCYNVPRGYVVAYGGPGGLYYNAYIYNTQLTGQNSQNIPCNSATFGNVSLPVSSPNCYTAPQPLEARGPAGFSYCATAGQLCPMQGVAAVAYGVDGNFVYAPGWGAGLSNPDTHFTCAVGQGSPFPTDQDPNPGVSEACYYRLY
jgi:glycerophosphoryl diester phosphodiesterase